MKDRIQRNLMLILLLAVSQISLQAATRVVTTYSNAMHKEIQAVVITPADYNDTISYPVLYLLHGYGGDYSDWITKVPGIQSYADLYDFLIVCPDGNVSSWYFDSPVDSTWKYESYIANELIPWIDQNYNTIPSPSGRAITGLSMGGHGAFFLAFRHQDVFGAAGSMSGGLDIIPFPDNWDISKRLGSYAEHLENWESHTVVNQVKLLDQTSLQIIFDCGIDDFFYKVNCTMHDRLSELKIPHVFISRPGSHTWDYWSNSIAYQALFFHRFFSK